MTDLDRAPAILSIDLTAVADNWRMVQALVGERCEAAGVVKADAYGLGAARVAPALAAAGCRTFFVATIDEGIALRRLMPDSRILILGGPLVRTEGDFLAHRLVPVLNSPEQVALWATFGRSHDGLEAAIHFDTGMARLGLTEADCGKIAEAPEILAGIRPVLVMSHMACADEDHPKNAEQLAGFCRLQSLLPKECGRSLAASSTIFLGSDYHFQMVRPGAALYGLNPTPDRANPMRAAVRLKGRILQVRDVDTPMTVGYGATHRVSGKGRIATVAAGYADGLFRSLGNRGFGIIGGVRVPIVGRISMDLTTFDVSAVAPSVAHPGAFVDIIGPDHDVDTLAAEAGTIGYEVLTALGARYARVYEG